MIVAGLDRENGKRWIVDGFNKANCAPKEIHDKVKYFTDVYHINEWVIERNALQTLLTRDQDLVNFLRSRGCKLTEHNTNTNKYDQDYGVATMAPLFDTCGDQTPRTPAGAGSARSALRSSTCRAFGRTSGLTTWFSSSLSGSRMACRRALSLTLSWRCGLPTSPFLES